MHKKSEKEHFIEKFTIHRLETIMLFFDTYISICNNRIQQMESLHKRSEWTVALVNGLVIIVATLVGRESLSTQPILCTIMLCLMLLTLLLGYYHKLLNNLIVSRLYQTLVLCSLSKHAIEQEFLKSNKIKVYELPSERPLKYFDSWDLENSSVVLDLQWYIFSDGCYFPEPFYGHFREQLYHDEQSTNVAVFIDKALHWILFGQLTIVLLIINSKIFPNFHITSSLKEYWIIAVTVLVILFFIRRVLLTMAQIRPNNIRNKRLARTKKNHSAVASDNKFNDVKTNPLKKKSKES